MKFASKKKQTGEDDISYRVTDADKIILPGIFTSLTFKQAALIILNEAKMITDVPESSNRK